MKRTVIPTAFLLLSPLLLTACQAPPTTPRAPDQLPFMGSWDCGVTVMTFMPDSYLPSKDADPIRVTRYATQNRVTEITLADGATMQVQWHTDNRIVWLSGSTGDSFECHRVAG